MKRIILLASALALGGVAYAQDSTQSSTTPDAQATQPGTGDMSAPPATPDQSGMPTDQSGTPPTGDQSGTSMSTDQGGMATGGDNSGSGAMQQPATPDQSSGGAMGGAMGGQPTGTATGPNGPVSLTPTQGPTDLPACSATVTDNCKQAHNGGGMTHHRTMHHRRGK